MKLFQIQGSGIETIPERSYRDADIAAKGELTLEEFLVHHPEIIPGEQIDAAEPPRFVTVRSQAGVTPGSMDVLLLDHRGVPTVVEAKLIDNREIRRGVLAQGIEYLAHVESEWGAERFVDEGFVFWRQMGADFRELFELRTQVMLDDEYLQSVTTNINERRMRLIIAADVIPSGLRRTIEFLHESADFDVYGLEVHLFAIDDSSPRLLVPQIVTITERAKDQKAAKRGDPWTEDRFFDRLGESASEDCVLIAHDLKKFGEQVTGRLVDWGTGKVTGSFTARLGVAKEIFSIFSVYTDGGFSVNIGWNAARINRLGSNVYETYRQRTNSLFAVDIDEMHWTAGYGQLTLALLAGRVDPFKDMIHQMAADLQRVVAGAQAPE